MKRFIKHDTGQLILFINKKNSRTSRVVALLSVLELGAERNSMG